MGRGTLTLLCGREPGPLGASACSTSLPFPPSTVWGRESWPSTLMHRSLHSVPTALE